MRAALGEATSFGVACHCTGSEVEIACNLRGAQLPRSAAATLSAGSNGKLWDRQGFFDHVPVSEKRSRRKGKGTVSADEEEEGKETMATATRTASAIVQVV